MFSKNSRPDGSISVIAFLRGERVIEGSSLTAKAELDEKSAAVWHVNTASSVIIHPDEKRQSFGNQLEFSRKYEKIQGTEVFVFTFMKQFYAQNTPNDGFRLQQAQGFCLIMLQVFQDVSFYLADCFHPLIKI
jgi:hypothetical protein